MKIVHICMTQYSNGWTYQENLLSKYHKLTGNDVTMITSMYHYKEGKLVEDIKSEFLDINGVKVIRLEKNSDGFMKKMPKYNYFYETLCKEEPEIIFSHGCQYRDVVFVCKYLKDNPKVKLFVDNHADYSNSATNFISKNILHKVIWKYYAHKLLPYTEKFWGVLPGRVDFLTDVYGLPKDKCELLVMGADDEFVEKSISEMADRKLRIKFDIKKEDFLIVTGGKIDRAKLQIELLIKAVSNLDKEHIKLLIFGSIEDEIKDKIMSLVDGKKIIYAGWITPEQSYDYFAIADLVVFPGRHSVFWEQAAGQGKPMICKSWAGTHHVDVGGNVLFLKKDDVREIMSLLNSILDDKETYERMSNIAQKKGMSYFSYKKISSRSIMK